MGMHEMATSTYSGSVRSDMAVCCFEFPLKAVVLASVALVAMHLALTIDDKLSCALPYLPLTLAFLGYLGFLAGILLEFSIFCSAKNCAWYCTENYIW